ncbi:hypothetical protein L0B53_15705 [Vibrio sp. SS-MA-C1-2]|uniref:hypothetical protein n=1 Tax=Vibrio sp. SS-MA-C1-2 TaxID=2908646 RepID=UPI001F379144|nr:hypothetical protein [Vibrio sp. SS-MA-C1-2]UJF18451.1 hypothetical protein L0B53_15705 [Vibrio sp. SS-MA-C1-2]
MDVEIELQITELEEKITRTEGFIQTLVPSEYLTNDFIKANKRSVANMKVRIALLRKYHKV